MTVRYRPRSTAAAAAAAAALGPPAPPADLWVFPATAERAPLLVNNKVLAVPLPAPLWPPAPLPWPPVRPFHMVRTDLRVGMH